MTYKLLNDKDGNELDIIIRKADGASIPKVTGNADYQDYLKWVNEGPTPEAAD